MNELDRAIHEPARLRIMTILSNLDSSDFNFLLTALDLTKGNLATHIARLEQAGYVKVTKEFRGKIPHTQYRITPVGSKAIASYWVTLDEIRRAGASNEKG